MTILPPELACLMCGKPMSDAVALSCGHSICFSCTNQQSLSCPHCREDVTIALHDNKAVSSFVSHFKQPAQSPIDKILPQVENFYAFDDFYLKQTDTSTIRKNFLVINGFVIQICIYPQHVRDRRYIAISVQMRPPPTPSSVISQQIQDCSSLGALYRNFERERASAAPLSPSLASPDIAVNSPPRRQVRIVARLMNRLDPKKSVQVNETYDFPSGMDEGLFVPVGPRENVFDPIHGFADGNREVCFSVELYLDGNITLPPQFYAFCSANETLSPSELRALGQIRSLIQSPTRPTVEKFAESVGVFLDLQGDNLPDVEFDGSISPSMLLLISLLRSAANSNFYCEEEQDQFISISQMLCQSQPYLPLLEFLVAFAKAHQKNDGFEIIEPLIQSAPSQAMKSLLASGADLMLASKSLTHPMILSTQRGIRIGASQEYQEMASQKIDDLFPDYSIHFSGKAAESEDLSSLEFDIEEKPKKTVSHRVDPWKSKYLRLLERHEAEVAFLKDENQRNIRAEQQRTAKAMIEKIACETEIKKLTHKSIEDENLKKEAQTELLTSKSANTFLETLLKEKESALESYTRIFEQYSSDSQKNIKLFKDICSLINNKSI